MNDLYQVRGRCWGGGGGGGGLCDCWNWTLNNSLFEILLSLLHYILASKTKMLYKGNCTCVCACAFAHVWGGFSGTGCTLAVQTPKTFFSFFPHVCACDKEAKRRSFTIGLRSTMWSWGRLYHNLVHHPPRQKFRFVIFFPPHNSNLQVHMQKKHNISQTYRWMANLACYAGECKTMQIRCKEWVRAMMENFFLAQRHPLHCSGKVNKTCLVVMLHSWLHISGVYLLNYWTLSIFFFFTCYRSR